jgi:hypothetical protein
MMNYYNSLGTGLITGSLRTWQKKMAFMLFFVMFSVLSVQGQNVTVTGAVTGNGSYATLNAAFTAIGTSQAGATIGVSVVGNTTEAASAVLGAGNWTSLTITPSGARTVTGAITGHLIDLSGAKNVTIDGLNSGGNSLTISNTAIGASSTIRFTGNAANDTVTNTTLLGSASTAAFGVVMLGSGVAAGITGITLSNDIISAAGSNLPINAIYSAGASGTLLNSATVTGNNISDFFSAGSATCGINVNSNNTGWTITNNKLFQSATRLYTTANTHNGINIASGAGYTITGNVIGYANASSTGTTNMVGNTVSLTGTFPSAYNTTGTANATRYIAINTAFTAAGAVSSIQNNTIGGFALYTSSGATTTNGAFCGINVTSGNANIGTTTGNIIGGTSGNSSIYAAVGTSGGVVVGIYATSANTVSIQNNTIGSIDASGTTASQAGSITAIDVAGAGNFTVSSNNIGNTTASNLRAGYFLTTTFLTNANGTATSSSGASAIIGVRSAMTGNVLAINSNIFRGWSAAGTITTVTGITSSGTMTGTTPSTNINLNSLGTSALGWVNYPFASSGSLNGISCTNTVATVSNINTNDFRGITYAIAGSNSHTYITFSNASAGNVATIDGNTFTNLNINTTGSVTFVGHNYVISTTGSMGINNNSIVTAFNKTGAGGSVIISSTNSTSNAGSICNYINNNFSNITVTGATTLTGLNNTDGGTGSAKTVTGNTFNNWTGGTNTLIPLNITYFSGTSTVSSNVVTGITGQGAITGINLGSAASGTAVTVASNTINNLSSTGTGGAVTGLFCSNVSTTININNNAINTLSSTGASAVVGLSIGGAATTNVFLNKIYDLSGSNAGSTVNGLLISSGLNVNVYNNLVGDLRTSVASGNDVIRGVNITATTALATYKIYYNSIYFNATSTGTNFGSTGIFHTYSATATSGVLDLRNNIIVNASGAAGTGLAVAFRRSTNTDLNNYATTSNNNLFFGTSGVFNNGTNYASLAAFQAISGARETASKSQNPTFTSTTGSNAGFLHFTAGSINLAGGNGQAIAGFTTDYDANTRDASTPDIGADEFVQGAAATPTLVSFSPTTLCVSGGQTVTITGTNLDTATAVSFNGVLGGISATTATTISAIVPANISDGTITVTTAGGSVTSASTYTVAPTPTIGVTSAQTICTGGAGVLLTATGGLNYTWSPAAGLSDVTGPSVTANPTTTTTYTVTGISAAGCSSTATVVITVNTTPSAVTVTKNPSSVCSNNITTLTATGGTIGGSASGTLGAGGTNTFNYDGIFYHLFGGLKTQFLVKASELTAQGVTAGNINSLGITMSTVTAATYAGFAVNIAPTALTAMTTTMVSAGLTQVYTAALFSPNTGLNTLTFSTPFVWDGTSNIIIQMCWSNANGGGQSNYALADSTPFVSCSYYRVDNVIPATLCATTAATSTTSNRPKFIFGYSTSVPTTFLWSPTTDLYADAAGNTAYTNQNQTTVYSKGTATRAYTATSTSNGCGSVSNTITVTPNALPTISVNNATICKGGSVGLTANGASTYTWKIGAATPFATTTSVTVSPTATTTYTITGTDANGCINTTTATVTVNDPAIITLQPSNSAVAEGSDATFTVVATGTGLTYQWEVDMHDSAGFNPILGATGASYTATSVTSGMTGYTYHVIVYGTPPCGSVTSLDRTLTISSVGITAQPQNQTVCSNTNATFSITASGVTAYQWQVYNGTAYVDLPGETSASLVLNGFTSANTGLLYHVLLNGGISGGGVTSDPAILTVYDAPVLTTQPSNQTLCSGATSVTFNSLATGSGIGYQWQLNTGTGFNNIAGATSPSFTINTPAVALSGNQYRVMISGTAPCSPLPSNVATLTISQAVAITTQPTAVVVCAGSLTTPSFSVVANGSGLTYQWVANNGSDTVLVNGTDFSGATSASLTVLTPAAYSGYTFKCVVSGVAPCAAVTSNAVLLTVSQLLVGTKTVGTGGDFATLTAAVAAYNSSTCISGNVVFNLTNTSYTAAAGEVFPITINANANAGSNTLTIKPNTTATITGASLSSIIKINGGDRIIIDGSNNGSTSKDLTIENSEASIEVDTAVLWVAATATDGATNDTFKNLILKGNDRLTTLANIATGGTTINSVAAVANNNLVIQNNTCIKSYFGILLVGSSTAQTGTVVSGNTIGSATASEYIGDLGIFLSGVNGAQCNNNTIFNIIGTEGNPTGIYIGGGTTNSTFNANRIDGLRYTGTSGYGGKGFDINTGSTASNLVISNNVISNIGGDGWNSLLGDAIVGIRIGATAGSTTTTGGIKLYNNSVNLSGSFAGNFSGTNSAALYISSSATAIDIRNNILVSTLDNTTTSSDATYAINSAASSTAFSAIDYNDYYVSGTPGILGFIGSSRATLAAIVTGFGGNANSKNIAPNFTSAGDLHMVTGANSTLSNLGITIAGITTDIDGDTRNISTPDIGADEWNVLTCATQSLAGGTAVSTGYSFCNTGSFTLSVTGATQGEGTTYQWQSAGDVNFATTITDIGTAGVVAASLATGSLSASTFYRLKVVCNLGTPVYSNVVSIIKNIPAVTTVSPAVAICYGSSTILEAAGSSTYAWSPSTGLSATTGLNVTANPTVSTTYTVTGTDANGCTSTASVVVTVNTYPSAVSVTQGASEVCVNNVMSLTATGGTIINSTASASQYLMTPSAGTFTPLSGATAVSSILADTAISTALPLGFSFTFGDNSYTTVKADSNGLLSFNNAASSTTTNNLTSPASTLVPFIAPLWDDNDGRASAANASSASYLTTGSAGNRIFTFEWLNWEWNFNATAAVISHQVKLYESDGHIEFVYRSDGTAVNVGSASVGISTAVGNYLSLGSLGANPTTSSTTEVSTILDKPVSGQVYSFAKPLLPTPITWSPTTDLYTNVDGTIAYTGGPAATVYTKPAANISYTVKASNGTCSTSGTTNVVTKPLPEFSLADVTICGGQSTTLTATGTGNSYIWTPSTGLDSTTGVSVVAHPTVTTTYTVQATNINNSCIKLKTVTVTVDSPAAITTEPETANVTIGQATDFHIIATGTGITYQWMVDNGSGMAPITDGGIYSGATSATLHISSPTSEMNGYQYQCVVSGNALCTAPATSVAVSLNVDVTGITTQPVNTTACAGGSTTFVTVAASTDPEQAITYSWEVKIGEEFVPVADGNDVLTGLTFSGAETGNLTMSGISLSNSGLIFHALVNGYIFSSNATLSVNVPTLITTQPAGNVSVCLGAPATLTVAASNATGYQWRVSTDSGNAWADIAGATSASLTFTPTLTQNGYQYMVIVSALSGCAAVPSNVSTLHVLNPTISTNPSASTILRGSTATFSVVANGATSYQWQYSTSVNGTYSNVVDNTPNGMTYSGANTNSLSVTTSNASYGGSGYYYRAIALNGSCNATSIGAQLTVNWYCKPADATTSATSYFDAFATTGGLTNIDNSASGFSPTGFGDFTNLSVSQYQGVPVNFTTTLAGTTVGVAIWVDWNHNLTFETTERVYNTTGYVSASSGSFTVPTTALTGDTVMRVYLDFNNNNPANPCGPFSAGRGEVEDYTFNVQPQPSCSGAPTAGTATVSSVIACGGASVSLSVTGATSGLLNITHQWSLSTDGTNFSPISGATSTTYATPAFTVSGTYYYYDTVTCTSVGGSSVNTNTVSTVVSAPLITGSTPAGRCGPGAVTLGATANAGASINWYDSATGGSLVGTGASFTTPSISTSTNYYAEAITGGGTNSVGRANAGATTSGFLDTNTGLVFDATSSYTIASATVYPVGTGTLTFALLNSSGTEIAATSAISVTGTGSTAVSVPLNLPVTPGTGYRLVTKAYTGLTDLVRESGAGGYPYTSGPMSITSGYFLGTSTSYYYFYNIQLATGCSSARTLVAATITPKPTAVVSYTGSPFCSTVSTATVSLGGTNAYTGGTYTSTPGLTLNGSTGLVNVATSTPGTYTVTYHIPDTANCTGLSATGTIVINQALTSGFTYGAATYCSNQGNATPVLTGAAGVFTSSPAGLTLNGSTGVVTLATSAAGTYTVTNTVTVPGCSVNFTTASVTVQTAVSIVSQPVSVSKLPTENTSFTVAATGTGLTYQWQVNSGSGYVNVVDDATYAGATSNTLALTAVTSAMNGYLYQVIVSGASACSLVTSAPATLTVSTVSITSQPANFTACSEDTNTATFAVTTSGTVLSYQWQVNTGSGFTNITNGGIYVGADTATLALSGLSLANDTWQFRVVLNNGDVNSNAATLSIKTAINVTTQPSNAIGCSTGSASFTVVASGTAPTYQWQVNSGSGFANLAGATAATLTLNGLTAAMNGYQYQVIISGASPCTPETSTTAILTVNTVVAIGTHPTNVSACPATNASFSVAATGTGLMYQWQVNTGTGYNAISGQTAATLTLNGVTTAMNGYLYRVVVSGATSCSAVTSNGATLTVSQPTLPVITASASTFCPGGIVTLSTSNGAYTNNFDALPSTFATSAVGTGTPSATLNTTYKAEGTGSVLFRTASGNANVAYSMNADVNLSGLPSAQVTFSHIAALEDATVAYDLGYVEYSADGGTTWATFPNSAYAGTGTLIPAQGDDSIPVSGVVFSTRSYPDWMTAFSSSTSTPTNALWKNETINVPAAALTSQFRLRFRIAADPNVAYFGWLIDNVKVGEAVSRVWSPTTGLYTDAAATTAYTGGNAATVYAKPGSTTTYTVTATNTSTCTNSASSTLTMLPTPTLSGVSQPVTTCAGSPTTFNLSGLIPSSTSTITYTVNGVNPQTVTGVVANASGAGSFTASLAAFTNGQTLAVTAIQRTDNAPSCSATITTNNTAVISVQPIVTYYRDADGDTFGNAAITQITCTGAPVGYVTNNTDCNDADATKYQLSALLYIDADGDTYDAGQTTVCYGATLPSGYSATTSGSDCNDADATKHATFAFYADTDGDTYGAGSLVQACAVDALTAPAGYSLNNTDCAPADASKYQSAVLYVDVDADLYNAGQQTVCYGASVPTGYSATTLGTDCNDNDATKYQSVNLYTDVDGDGYDAGTGQVPVCYGATVPAGYSATTLGTDCNDNDNTLTTDCSAAGAVVNLTMFVQGYYTFDHAMNSVRVNQEIEGAEISEVEMLTVELHDAEHYGLVAATTAMLHTDGSLSANFGTVAAGSYYIAVKGRNMIQTWSAVAQAVGTTPLDYDFSTSASQAYGDNMIDMGDGVFAFYSGDIVQDELIEFSDYSAWETDAFNFAFGDFATDLTGDGLVEFSDYSIWEANAFNFIFAEYPFE